MGKGGLVCEVQGPPRFAVLQQRGASFCWPQSPLVPRCIICFMAWLRS